MIVGNSAIDKLDAKTLVVKEKYRLNRETALIGTNQGLFVVKLNDRGEIVSLSVYGKGEQQ